MAAFFCFRTFHLYIHIYIIYISPLLPKEIYLYHVGYPFSARCLLAYSVTRCTYRKPGGPPSHHHCFFHPLQNCIGRAVTGVELMSQTYLDWLSSTKTEHPVSWQLDAIGVIKNPGSNDQQTEVGTEMGMEHRDLKDLESVGARGWRSSQAAQSYWGRWRCACLCFSSWAPVKSATCTTPFKPHSLT